MLIVWVISLPALALFIMYKYILKNSQNEKIILNFLILYQGFKKSHFYWEFVNSLRKIFILLCFLMPSEVKFVSAAAVLIISWRVQNHLQPYKVKANNEIEMLGVNIGVITLCCGMAYDQQDGSTRLNNFLLFLIISLNIIFITKWLYLLFKNFGQKYQFFQKVKLTIIFRFLRF